MWSTASKLTQVNPAALAGYTTQPGRFRRMCSETRRCARANGRRGLWHSKTLYVKTRLTRMRCQSAAIDCCSMAWCCCAVICGPASGRDLRPARYTAMSARPGPFCSQSASGSRNLHLKCHSRGGPTDPGDSLQGNMIVKDVQWGLKLAIESERHLELPKTAANAGAICGAGHFYPTLADAEPHLKARVLRDRLFLHRHMT